MKVIVTLTTLPSRIVQDYDAGIKSNIDSLINQEYDGDYEIHFNVPSVFKYTNQEYTIPEWMRELSLTNPKFKIFDNLEDLGPITKLVHTLRRSDNPDDIIIVCDDDLVYHPKMVDEHVKNQQLYENTAIGYDGGKVLSPLIFDDIRNHFVVSVPQNVYVSHLQHYKTISYRRKWFDEDFFTDFVGKSWNDDLVVSAYMGKQGIQKMVACYEGEEKLVTLEQWQAKGGVTTFPVLRHTSHEGQEGCTLYRMDKIDDNHMYFFQNGYLQ